MTDQNTKSISENRYLLLGIASLVIGLFVPALIFLLFVLMVQARDFGIKGTVFEDYISMAFKIFALSAPLFHLLGVVLGGIGWFLAKRHRWLPATAMIVNLLFGIIGLGILILFGLFMLILPLGVAH